MKEISYPLLANQDLTALFRGLEVFYSLIFFPSEVTALLSH